MSGRKSTEVSKGIRYLSSAADKEFEPAIYTLGKYYSSFNNTNAKEYLKRSAFEYNDPNAQYILGKMYLSENKNEMAEKCFRQCALNGNNSGQLAYGLMLLRDGQAVKKRIYHLSSDLQAVCRRRGHFFINHQVCCATPLNLRKQKPHVL